MSHKRHNFQTRYILRILICLLVAVLSQYHLVAEEWSPEQIKQAEIRLSQHPTDIKTRTQLLEAYSYNAFEDRSAQAAAIPHAVWIINNYPDWDGLIYIGSMLDLHPEMSGDPSHYHVIKQAFLNALTTNPKSDRLHGCYGSYLLLNDFDSATKHLEQAINLNQDSAEWHYTLATAIYHHFSSSNNKEHRKGLAQKAQKHFAHADQLNNDAEEAFYYLLDWGWSCFAAGDLASAKKIAKRTLILADKQFKDDWNYGNALHDGNCILGACACMSGDLELAKKHLLLAGDSPGSPQLDSFGPDFSLAKALANRGQGQVVIAYLEKISRFWTMDDGAIGRWTTQLTNNQAVNWDVSLHDIRILEQ